MNKSQLKLISILERVGGFASAQELHQLLRRDGDSIGLTTVYRALQSLLNDRIVDVLRRDDGESIYRLCGESHHHHLICRSCGATKEIEGSSVEKWADAVAAEHAYREVSHVVELFGLCDNC
jgi:Fur family ferric uptake transcriptional regulator